MYLNFGAKYLNFGAKYLDFGAKAVKLYVCRVWKGGGWVPQDLQEVSASLSGKNVPPIPCHKKNFQFLQVSFGHCRHLVASQVTRRKDMKVLHRFAQPLRHFLTERYRIWISWYLDVSPSWCRHFQYLGFLTVAPTTNFARKRVKTRYLTLFRATKNCVVICRASLLYEMGYPLMMMMIAFITFKSSLVPLLEGLWS